MIFLSEQYAAMGLAPDAVINTAGDRLVSISPPQSKLLTKFIAAGVAGKFESADDAGALRLMRDELLLITDWTQANDSPLTVEQRAAWATYRQALRDLPGVYSGDGPIPWPIAP